MIEFRDLSFSYRGCGVLHHVNLVVPQGKITLLLGPNGSGKSTLLKIAAGILPADGGVYLDGEDVRGMTPRARARRVSYMAQTRNTANIVARAMVLHGRFPYLSFPRRYSKSDREIADRSLAAADAADVADRAVPELSGGQRQKVYLAMTLAQDTGTVLMDEPLNFLDIRHQLALTELARRLAGSGKAVLLVMHDLRIAMQTADLVAVMDDGRIRAFGTPDEIYDSGVLDDVFRVTLLKTETEYGPRYFYR